MLKPLRLGAALVCAAACLAGATPVEAHPGIDVQIADLTERIAANPADATLYLRRGELHRIHRDWDAAEADFRHAIKLDPELTVVERSRGQMLIDSGRAAAAVEPLRAYLAKRPGETKTLSLLARALVETGRHDEAAKTYTMTIASVRDGKPRPEYFLERARSLAALGPERWDEAIRGLDEGLAALNEPVTLHLYPIPRRNSC